MARSTSLTDTHWDVVVIGAGNAGLCAALAALQEGATVLIIEKAPRRHRGGNTRYTGFYRFHYNGLSDLRRLCHIDPAMGKKIRVEPYSADSYYRDLMEVSDGRANSELMRILADESFETMSWLAANGLKWELNREGSRVDDDGRLVWHPCTIVRPRKGGVGILSALFSAVERQGGDVAYEAALKDLLLSDSGGVAGLLVERDTGIESIQAKSAILAAGGFEANQAMRAKHLGSSWGSVKVRGSRFNSGECLEIALAHGAARSGEWSGCHATMVHAGAPKREMGENVLFPFLYPYGIVVDEHGRRFVDEGESFHFNTYAKLGERVLDAPSHRAFQVFDAKTKNLRQGDGAAAPELVYKVPHSTADTLQELAALCGIEDAGRFIATVDEYNSATQPGPFDPSRLDGKRTVGLNIDKTNWALPIDTPPYEAFPVEVGITFTYGGLSCKSNGEVVHKSGDIIPGLYAVGEIAGTFYGNYLGGAGLTKGAVFGRRAGRHASLRADSREGGLQG